jgi:hypothetical protein
MAQQRALFISESFIKNNSEIDDNVDVKKLLPTVWWCQKAYIETALGTPLFDDLSTKVIAGTLAGDDLTLVDNYIADALLNWFMVEVQIALVYNYRNKSIGKNDSQWSDFIDAKELRFLRDQYKPRADYYIERLETYLCAKSSLYPKYTAPVTSDQIKPTDQAPQIPVYLGGAIPIKNKFLNSQPEE